MTSTESICSECRQIFNGTLVPFSTGQASAAQQWMIGTRPSNGLNSKSSWEIEEIWKQAFTDLSAVFDFMSLPEFSYYQPSRSEGLPAGHHSCEGLITSAENGCSCCQQLLKSLDFLQPRSTSMQETGGARGIPVLRYQHRKNEHIAFPMEPELLEDGVIILNIYYPCTSNVFAVYDLPSIRLIGPRSPASSSAGSSSYLPRQAITTLKRWLDACSHHEACLKWRKSYSLIFSDKPRRLLQICKGLQGNLDKIRIREYADIECDATGINYITLSHCWGGIDIPGKLESTNFGQYVEGVPIDHLPRTFRHVIRTVTALGFEYLWIDALCIVQDSRDDWAREAPRMGSVYSNAILNFAASASSHSKKGLFQQPGRQGCGVYLNLEGADFAPGRYLMYANKRAGPEYGRNPLNRRAWVFQERLFSHRIIEFLHPQIQWHCRQHWGTDNYSSHPDCGRIRPADPSVDAFFWLMPRGLGEVSVRQSRQGPLSAWHTLCKEYARRDLSRASDRLVAFSAIAKAFAHANDMEASDYLAGLWRPVLNNQLLWRVESHFQQEEALNKVSVPLAKVHVPPSWSWSSLSHSVSLSDPEDGKANWQPEFEILSASTQSSDDEGFGSVSAGYIDLQCLAFSIRIWKNPMEFSRYSHRCEIKDHGSYGCRYYPDKEVDSQGDEEYGGISSPAMSFVPVAYYDDEPDPPFIEGLVIRSLEDDEPDNKANKESLKLFERLGIMKFGPKLNQWGLAQPSRRWRAATSWWKPISRLKDSARWNNARRSSKIRLV